MEENFEQNNIELQTCTALKSELCGSIVKMTYEEVITKFVPTKQMISDESNLIHSGFIFNAANYAAMCLANQPHAITIGSEVEFLAPVEFEQEMMFLATIKQSNSKKFEISVKGTLLDIKIFEGTFHIAVFEKQLFKLNFKD
ncbi:thioesterase [Helicobacter cholecystus]|uniref:Thioesterase n=1 Tax=Helicobacter cholecystus TaxID=45498 RepID=A0A3D8IYW8_9HELI|nr:thioesterase [Helicobacter cholecystus]RDU70095.1 thioesterase [Helicobacter cholecystus]VEJ24728.1 Thioesterase superfamily protein [Helicobacter cholecystus]